MKTSTISNEHWEEALKSLKKGDAFGFPRRRRSSVLIGTFNIRSLGSRDNRSTQAWGLLTKICKQYDLLAIQEVADDMEGLLYLMQLMGPGFGLIVSDITGAAPGRRGKAERLAFIYRKSRVRPGPMASDITHDKTYTLNSLRNADVSWTRWLNDVTVKAKVPSFIGFIRTPHCVTFDILGKSRAAKPYQLTVVNAHLLYGTDKRERKWEFDALLEWLYVRAKNDDRMIYPDILMMGDCNVEFKDIGVKREEVDALLKGLNASLVKSRSPARVNFPLLSEHPKHGMIRTNARSTETYDQMALFARDARLPGYEQNAQAGSAYNGWDYGVFNFVEMLSRAVYGESFDSLFANERKELAKGFQWDISDHLPVWMRLRMPV